MSAYLKTSSQGVLNSASNTYNGVFSDVPTPTLAGMQEIAREDQAAGILKGKVDVASMVDPSFVEQLQKNGFISEVDAGGS